MERLKRPGHKDETGHMGSAAMWSKSRGDPPPFGTALSETDVWFPFTPRLIRRELGDLGNGDYSVCVEPVQDANHEDDGPELRKERPRGTAHHRTTGEDGVGISPFIGVALSIDQPERPPQTGRSPCPPRPFNG